MTDGTSAKIETRKTRDMRLKSAQVPGSLHISSNQQRITKLAEAGLNSQIGPAVPVIKALDRDRKIPPLNEDTPRPCANIFNSLGHWK
jgi:hypothetical protein